MRRLLVLLSLSLAAFGLAACDDDIDSPPIGPGGGGPGGGGGGPAIDAMPGAPDAMATIDAMPMADGYSDQGNQGSEGGE